MQKLSRSGAATSDNTQIIAKDQQMDFASLTGSVLIHVNQYIEHAAVLADHPNVAVWLDSDDDAHVLKPYIKKLTTVAANFPLFMDGRAFSQARILKSVLGYQGELLAIGAFMQDQLFYLKRCGFDGFLVPDDANIESMRSSLEDFQNTYQASADDPRPIYRKRGAILQ